MEVYAKKRPAYYPEKAVKQGANNVRAREEKTLEKYFEKMLKKGVDKWVGPYYHIDKQGRNGSPTYPIQTGGDTMTVTEIFGLLTLLAVVIFGVIEATKK